MPMRHASSAHTAPNFPPTSVQQKSTFMARDITSFSGTTCVVGRNWASQYKIKGDRIKFSAPAWYQYDPDPHHSPGTSYYIDIAERCAADLVADFGKPLSPALIPDGRFDLLILEFLPTSLLTEQGCSTYTNAKRILKTGGRLEIHSGKGVLRSASAFLESMSFSGTRMDEHHRTMRTPSASSRNTSSQAGPKGI